MKLDVPLVGDVTVRVAITEKTEAIRFSLRTADPAEGKIRQANALAYIEDVFRAVGENLPATFTHEKAVAFSKRMYDGWASNKRSRTLSVRLYPSRGTPGEEGYEPSSIGSVLEGEVPDIEGAASLEQPIPSLPRSSRSYFKFSRYAFPVLQLQAHRYCQGQHDASS